MTDFHRLPPVSRRTRSFSALCGSDIRAAAFGHHERRVDEAFFFIKLGRKQDQMAQNIATRQAAEQEVSQKVSASPSPPPAPKPVRVPPPAPKSLQPPAQ